MRTHFWLIVVLIVGMSGFALGYALSDGPESRITVGMPDRPSSQPGHQAHPLDSGAVPPPDSEPEELPERADPFLDGFKHIELDVPPAVEGRITAKVVDSSGEPVAGVEVTILPRFPHAVWMRPHRIPDTEEEFWETIDKNFRPAAQWFVGGFRYSQHGSTNDHGGVEFDGLIDTPYGMSAQLPDATLEPDRRPYNLKPGDHVTWTVKRPGRVRVYVEPHPAVDTINVEATRGDWTRGVERVGDAKPGEWQELTLAPGEWKVRARTKNGGYVSEETTVAVDDETIELRLSLTGIARLEIRVEYQGGRPVGGETVRYARARPELTDEEHFDSRRPVTFTVSKRSTGYHLNTLEPGDYVIEVMPAAGAASYQRVSATPGPHVVTFRIDAPSEAEGIVCAVMLPDGKSGSTSFRVLLENEGNDQSRWKHIRHGIWYLDDNRYLLVDARGDGLNWVLKAVSATVDGLGTVSRNTSGRNGEVLTFRFDRPASVTVELANTTDRARGRVQVRVLNEGALWDQSSYHFNETLTFKDLQPGDYSIELRFRASSEVVLEQFECNLTAGESREFQFRLPDMFELIIETDRERIDLYGLVATDVNKLTFSTHVDEDGLCIVPCVPAGTYELSYRTRANPRVVLKKVVVVNSDTRVRLTR